VRRLRRLRLPEPAGHASPPSVLDPRDIRLTSHRLQSQDAPATY
jgi:hypothetical protein